ncbi:MAG TPA: galactose oxidase early set domain-containing protein, partial [Thermoplasmata archaeon]|nr:galactose oxidase early set domain-containing protein [Thermoplasmata archaeon]
SNPMRGVNELRIEIFRPPYLFRGARPVVDAIPVGVGYGQDFEAETPDAAEIAGASLLRPAATTHCVDSGQRCVRLEIRGRRAGRVTLRAPTNPNAAPPGDYLLFLLRDGVPSEGRFVALRP